MVQNNCIVELHRDEYVKDLGVVFDEKLNFSQHISERINKAYSMLCQLWLIRRNFRDIGPTAFVLIYCEEFGFSQNAPYTCVRISYNFPFKHSIVRIYRK